MIFALVFAASLAEQSSKGLAAYLTPMHLLKAALVSAVVVGGVVAVLLSMGWIRFGAAPYASPGFKTDLPETSAPVEPAGPAPTIKPKVRRGDLDTADEEHKRRLERFEGKDPKSK